MECEKFTRLANALQQPFGEFRLAEMPGHGGGQIAPKALTAADMNPFITDHGKLTGARRDKNQHRIPLPGLSHAQPNKLLLRRSDRIDGFFAADKNTDFAGGLPFGLTNRRH